MPHWRPVAALLTLCAYAWGSHWLMVNAPAQPWTVAALFGPLLVAVFIAGVKRRHVPSLIGAVLAGAVIAVVVTRGVAVGVNRLYVLQHAAIHAAIGWSFAITLRPGAKPFITALAERVHEVFTPEMRAYTRSLTAAWVLYFAAMIVVSLAIYAWAPWPWWSFFCNVLTPLAAVLMFVAEHLLRYHWHPEFERVSMARVFRQYQAHSASSQ